MPGDLPVMVCRIDPVPAGRQATDGHRVAADFGPLGVGFIRPDPVRKTRRPLW